MPLIEIKNMTKDYGSGRGIFDIDLSIEKGEVFGFVGTNGAGKTTTIRHLMGFLKPQSGSATINGLDCWKDSAEIKKRIGYIPGEIAFPDAPTGTEFLKRQAELVGLNNMSYMESIIKKMQLDPTANLKRMSKGMKQKTAIVASLMTDPDILILDEPTTGLDPLMRVEFLDILDEQKKKGKTIFMSSHMFEEVEHICDKVALIKDGKLIAVKSTSEIKHNEDKVYKIEFISQQDYFRFLSESFDFVDKQESKNQVIIHVHDRDINTLMKALKSYNIKFISENKYTLENYFKSLY
ncbi:ABC transporter ATP-binding protein [Pseudoneobacillus rhizosphaerae]|uniref:Multidrug efflux system ATP-binding protein n=1 Tax=Pseudoneobacillus rhizosphaerae TaxID=2880968 RepID=A0A9C7GC02_9BACI|nr:ATP-binding cassette domain-containing protein [Pseudoneobacillus rhizosphaerae]CAG9609430.1 Multidrug efflux system ATP-binding protein [Pseudoneobacillus rhizosphaerae]